MDLYELEAFLAVAEERSFSRAAARLHRTQPAISQVIRKLETGLGEVLLDRTSRDGALTAAGEVLREYAEKLLNLRAEAGVALDELRTLNRGRLSVAANEYTCLYLLPILDRFRRIAPRIKVSVHRSLASRVADELLSHAVEFGIVSFRPDDAQVRSVVVYRDELVLVVNPRHPLAKAKRASIEQLAKESFVAHNIPSPQRQKVVQAFRRFRMPLNMGIELPSLEAIKRCVALGNGIALLPGLSAQPEIERGDLVRIAVPELEFERKLRLVYRRKAHLSQAGMTFLKVVEEMSSALGDPFLFQPDRTA